MRSWNLKSKSHTPLDSIAQMVNPILRDGQIIMVNMVENLFKNYFGTSIYYLQNGQKLNIKPLDASPCT